MNCLLENSVGTDTWGRYGDVVGEVDNESVSFEELSYYPRPLGCAKMRKVESASLADVTWGNAPYRRLRGREVRMVWQNCLVDFVGYFRMDLVVKAARVEHELSSKAGMSATWNVFEFESVVGWAE